MKKIISMFLAAIMILSTVSLPVFAEETETKDIYELKVKFVYKDGSSETVAPGIIINVKTGECTNKDDSGMLGIGDLFDSLILNIVLKEQFLMYVIIKLHIPHKASQHIHIILTTLIPVLRDEVLCKGQ